MAVRFCGVLLPAAMALCCAAQQGISSSSGMALALLPQQPNSGVKSDSPGADDFWEAKRQRQLNVLRQKQLIANTDKLLRMVGELKAEIAADHASALTPDQLRRLAEIEKLARSVREGMETPIPGNSGTMSPPAGFFR
jgi:hypothetical protein